MPEAIRHLAAILFSDVVGYTALTGEDEARALRVRERHRALLRPLVEQCGGELVETKGDEALALFPSALLAVDCALAVQAALRNDTDLRLRIGIHLGDVLRQGGEVIGDGVNVAARVRPLADPGGICISEPVQRIVRSHPHIRTRSLGARSLKNVELPIQVFAVETDPSAIATLSRPRRLLKAAAGAALALVAVAGAVYPNRTAVLSSVALHAPFLFFPNPVEQRIGFATTSDGVRIAYATTGSGPPLVFVLGWMTHLERGLGSNLYDREGVIAERSKGHLLVRYDGRGFGMSQRDVEDFSLDARVRDIEAVVDALGLGRFAVYAVSAGGPAAVAYTARHPERVSGLVLAATFVGGPASSERRRQSEALADLYRVAWDQPAVRALFAARLGSNASDLEQRVLAEFLRVSADGPSVAGFIEANRGIDARDLARQIRVPALVVAGDLDVSVPLEASSELAALIPGSRFDVLRGADHMQATATSPRLRALVDEFLAEVQAERGG